MSYTKEELRELVKLNAISLVGDEIILDDTYIGKKEFVRNLREIYCESKEDFGQYKKSGKKSKNKIRKK